MRGLRRGVKGRVAWAVLLSVLVVSITLVSAGIALADKWTDISDVQWQSQYGVTAAQAATVAGGFQDGTFHPKEAVKRGQFAKMVVDGFGVSYYSPTTGTFPDVLKSNTFYKYVEGGYKAGIISGYSDGTFKPNNTVSRQQANNILGAYLSSRELDEKGVITGSRNTYTSLSAWYAAEGALILAAFKDATNVAAVHAPGTAYLVYHDVVKGSNGYLTPGSTLTRAQAVALIIRVRNTTFTGGTGVLPTVTGLSPAAGSVSGGNGVIITGTNFTGVTSVKFGAVSANFTVNGATQITATAPAGSDGTSVDVTVTTGGGTSVATVSSKYSYGAPVITKLEPNGGSALGGTTVTITGTGFAGVTYVKFGTVAAKSYVVLSSTQIAAVSPAGTTGTTVDVTVNTSAGSTVASAATKFSYGIPNITSLSPASGAAAGGTTVVITGSGFANITGADAVKFGSANATSYTVNSTTQITAVAPAGTSGSTVDVTVTNSIGTSGVLVSSKYSYGAPTVTLLTPNAGPVEGGNTVSITGTGFTGVTSVKFGNVNATSVSVTSVSSTSPYTATLSAVAPAGSAGTSVDVTVITAAGTSATSAASKYSYGIPTLTGLSPAAGPNSGGTTVIITGTNFIGIGGASAVKFGAVDALTYTVNSLTQITAVAPLPSAGGSTVDVVVANAAGSSVKSFASKYSYGAPAVTSVDPAAGGTAGGQTVTIKGTSFAGVTSVRFGVTSVVYSVNADATQITVAAPPGALDSTVDVTVTNPVGTSTVTANSKYRYVAAPSVTGVTPSSGTSAGGNTVTITGTYFVGVTSVRFGSATASNVTVVNETQLTCIAPPQGSMGANVGVVVTNPAGSSPNTVADDYTYGMPRITGLIPPAGASGGGNTVTIVGSGFVDVTKVEFVDFVPASDVVVLATVTGVNADRTQLSVLAPSGLPDRTVDVRVTNSTGTSTSSAASKYAYGAPFIDSISPTGGSAGTIVTISGHGFTGLTSGMTVTFTGASGGSATATITEIDTTNYAYIKVQAPAKGSMTNPVTVDVATAVDASNTKNFSYGVPVVTSITPAAGPTTAGQNILINGSNFTGATGVSVGGALAADKWSVNAAGTQIQATLPVHGSGTVPVIVTNAAGSSNNAADDLSNKYTFGPPTISGFSPTSGPAAAGTTVEITGDGFTGVSSVMFGLGNPATSVIVNSTTKLTVSAPSGTGSVNITVATAGGTATSVGTYTYGLPVITRVSPVSGSTAGGNVITLSGSGFTGATKVTIGATDILAASFLTNTDTSLTFTNPSHPAVGTVDVTVSKGSSTSMVTASTKYTYGPPSVTGLSPKGGSTTGGNDVTITGSGFAGVTSVKFGSTAAIGYTVDTLNQITATAPGGTAGTTVDVTVTTYTGATSSTSTNTKYSYGVPTIIGISPGAGSTSGGTTVVITGTNFSASGITGVQFDGVSATWAPIDSTHIAATAPPHAVVGTVEVKVSNGAGTSSNASSDLANKYSYGPPTVTSLSPVGGSTTGGEPVTITGTGFTGATAVKFGDTSVSYAVNSPTQIIATAPSGTASTWVYVTVTTYSPGGTSATGDQCKYGYGIPVVSSLSAGAGPVALANMITITGLNFTTAADMHVYFGSAEATIVGTPTATSVIVNVPLSGTVGEYSADHPTVNVTVSNGAGTSANTTADDYSYGVPKVINVTPATGPSAGGTVVYISGTGFTGTLSVIFGGYSATIDVANSTSTLLKVYAPPHPTGPWGVTVTSFGPSVDVVTYTYY